MEISSWPFAVLLNTDDSSILKSLLEALERFCEKGRASASPPIPVVVSSFDYSVVASWLAYVMPLTQYIGTSLPG